MVTVTLASADTLKRGGKEYIPGLSMDGHLASVDTLTRGGIPRLSVDGQSYSGIQGYSDVGVGWGGGGGHGHPWIIHGWSQLLSAKYKATVSIHGWQRIVYGTIGHICGGITNTN